MPRKKKVPKWGRKESEITAALDAEHGYSADVPLGNTDPTMVQGVMYGGMPNASRRAAGSLRVQRGKRN